MGWWGASFLVLGIFSQFQPKKEAPRGGSRKGGREDARGEESPFLVFSLPEASPTWETMSEMPGKGPEQPHCSLMRRVPDKTNLSLEDRAGFLVLIHLAASLLRAPTRPHPPCHSLSVPLALRSAALLSAQLRSAQLCTALHSSRQLYGFWLLESGHLPSTARAPRRNVPPQRFTQTARCSEAVGWPKWP